MQGKFVVDFSYMKYGLLYFVIAGAMQSDVNAGPLLPLKNQRPDDRAEIRIISLERLQ